ncbi:hypothetical protein FHW69_000897 [Luteibacter sp. Sphag1AF]|uniref:hypothetical protein n=1 Tax=Luteibacter sp. Sphag1AF TaxID=2587031 RepID=UPI001622EFB3|nr:hypothetical protein [Luteibacter sp. Sphag1AF]MBB3226307.1 hypothetical protein [Luteibacter sp. Sphag1AF]
MKAGIIATLLALLASGTGEAQVAPRPYVHDLDRRFDQYTWVTTHNAFNTWLSPVPNQSRNITRQLNDGVRALMLDLHEHQGGVWVCHASCLLGGYPLSNYLNQHIIPFLARNPEAVLTLHLEDHSTRRELHSELLRVPGLGALTFDPQRWSSTEWPTLREMIARHQRLVIFDLNRENAGDYPLLDGTATILASQDGTSENFWELGKTTLTHDNGCRSRWPDVGLGPAPVAFEGKTWQRLFVMNHFHALSEYFHAGVDNRYDVLRDRVYGHCMDAAGRVPNYLAIDYYEQGDAFELAGVIRQGGIVLYKGRDATGTPVCGVPGRMATGISMKSSDRRGCENDQARSATVTNVPAGTEFTVFDSPQASTKDDYAVVRVLRDLDNRTAIIPSFNRSLRTEDIELTVHYRNGLDGSISYVTVVPPSAASSR